MPPSQGQLNLKTLFGPGTRIQDDAYHMPSTLNFCFFLTLCGSPCRGHTTGMMEDERRVHATSSASNTGFAHRPSVSTVRALAATVPSPECDEYDEREEEPCTG